jgi:photosystem II stability/assembly factor-like uncharacterized protein
MLGLLCAACSSSPSSKPTWQLVFEKLPGALLRVWGTSSKDVYAVGANGDGHGPLFFHYDGTTWKRLDTGSTADLWWIDRVSADEIRAVGKGGAILAYHPSSRRFEAKTAPAPATLYGVWCAAADDCWYVGGNAGQTGVVWRDDGATIRPMDLGVKTSSAALFKVHGTSPGDVWIVGEQGISVHWNGSTFTPERTGVSQTLFTVHGIAAAHAYTVGGLVEGVLLRFDGSSWKNETPATPGGTMPGMNGVFEAADGTAYAAGYNGHVFRRDGGNGVWSEMSTSPEGSMLRVSYDDYHSIFVDEKNEIWASGGQLGTDPPTSGVLVHYGLPIPTTIAP